MENTETPAPMPEHGTFVLACSFLHPQALDDLEPGQPDGEPTFASVLPFVVEGPIAAVAELASFAVLSVTGYDNRTAAEVMSASDVKMVERAEIQAARVSLKPKKTVFPDFDTWWEEHEESLGRELITDPHALARQAFQDARKVEA